MISLDIFRDDKKMFYNVKDKKDLNSRKMELLDAAERVFSRHGYAATRMDDIAAEANVSKGSVYNYFRSKQEIFKEVFLYSQTKDSEIYDEIMNSPTLPVREKILKIIQTAFTRFDTKSHIGKLLMEFWALAGREETRGMNDVINELYRKYIKVIEDIIAQGQSCGELSRFTTPNMSARMLVAFLDGLGLQKILGIGGDWSLQDYAEISNTIDRIMGPIGSVKNI
ncbi:MAG TPA: TetR/AcrR family transcriptional regulator [Phycisphaerae bacterium]|nr:TetR/AcrR family transcriptional regulator [Phycisphaerae bacterium]HPS53341.1 TetR/AcrR family transcriptional regulator [Phycisphaerae bacterium]